METALRRIAEMLEGFADAVAAWFATGAWRPEAWPGITWLLVAALVVLSWLLAWRRRAPRSLDVRPPQLLVTSGEVVPDGADESGSRPSGRRRRRPTAEAHADAGAFAMTVSNLSRYPVQLLEVALRDGRRGAPRVATLDAVVPAMGSVSVSGRIPLGLRGDGLLDLYCYAAAPRVKVHRHRVELVWEPWAARFKAAPLEQLSAPARRLASDEPDARFLEDDVLEPAEPAAAVPVRPSERRDAAPPSAARPAPMAERTAAAPERPAPERPVLERAVPERTVPERPARPAIALEPEAPASLAPAPAPAAPASAPIVRPTEPTHATPPDAPSPNTPSSNAPSPASPGDEPRGVPRIATPPVGVAVAGRGGASARTADGLPIGRPTARTVPAAEDDPPREASDAPAPTPTPDREPAARTAPSAPTAPAAGAAAATRAPAAAGAATPARLEPPTRAAPGSPTNAASEDDRPPAEPARRRPRLEFPDEF